LEASLPKWQAGFFFNLPKLNGSKHLQVQVTDKQIGSAVVKLLYDFS